MFKVLNRFLRLSTHFFEYLKYIIYINILCNEYLKPCFLRYSFLCTECLNAILKSNLLPVASVRVKVGRVSHTRPLPGGQMR